MVTLSSRRPLRLGSMAALLLAALTLPRPVSVQAPPLFGSPVSYAAGTHTHAVGAYDVNSDGRLDLIAANSGSNSVSVFLGVGDGTFAPGQAYATGPAPKHVTVADFTGDTLLDLVTSNQDGGTVSLLRGNGNGTFAAAVHHTVCPRAHESAAADFNADGKRDLVVGCWGGSVITILLGGGDGTFAPAVNYTTQADPLSLVVGDYNGDGRVDVAAANNAANSVSVLLGTGSGTLQAATHHASGSNPHGIRAADLNGDGRLDLVNANLGGNSVSVLLATSTGSFAPAIEYPAGAAPAGIALADVTGDGIVDVLASNTGGNYPTCCNPGGDRIAVLAGTGNGTLASPELYLTGTTPFAVAVGDFNADGRPDVASANWDTNNVSVLLHTGDVDTVAPTVASVTPAAGATAVPVTTTPTATFSEAIDAATLTSGTFTLTPAGSTTAVAATITYAAGTRTATLTPTGSLLTGTQYTARVRGGATGVADLAGNRLAADYTWTFTTVSAVSGPQYLSDLTPTLATNGWGPYERDRSNADLAAGDGLPLTLNGTVFPKGLGAHAASDLRYSVPAGCSAFVAVVGVDDEVGPNGSVTFQVYGDATLLFDSGTMTGTSTSKSVSLSVSGRAQVRLVVTDAGNGAAYDHADWADAQFVCNGGGADTTAPTVSSVTPVSGATNVALTANATATFSEAMDASTVTSSTVTLTAAGSSTPVPATVTYDASTRTVTLDPNASLSAQVQYTARVRGGATGATDLAGNPLATDRTWTFTTATAPTGTLYLSDLTPRLASNGWGPVERDKSNGDLAAGDGGPLTIGGVVFAKGLGVHAASDVRYDVPVGCTTFATVVGVDDEVGTLGSVVFQAWADGVKLFDSGTMLGSSPNRPLSLDLTGRAQLQLVVTDAGNGNGHDHADWADAKLTCNGGADTTPPTVTSTSPASNATGVGLTAPVSATFSEAMNAATITASSMTLTAAGSSTPVAATVAYSSTTLTATLTPGAALAPLVQYTARVRGGTSGVADLAGNRLATDRTWTFTTAAAPSGTVYLSDLTPSAATNGWGPYERDASNGDLAAGDGVTQRLEGTSFPKGLGVHAAADLRYAIPTGCSIFSATLGVDDEVGSNGSVVFQVWKDATKIFDSGIMRGTSPNRQVALDVSAGAQLRLVVTDAGDGAAYDHADWAMAQFTCSGGGSDTTPPSITSKTPAAGASAVPLTARITAVFSEAMNAATLTSSTVTLTSATNSAPVAAAVSYDVATRTVTLAPGAPLAPQVQYTARIAGGAGGATDVAGNALAATESWTFTTASGLSGLVYLSDLTPSAALNGWGPIERDQSNGDSAAGDGAPLTLNGVSYARGLGVHAASDVRYDVPAGCTTLTGFVGVDDQVGANGSVAFLVYTDGSKVFDSGLMTGATATRTLNLSVAGKAQVRLVVTDGGNGIAFDHGDWADAQLHCGTSTLGIDDVSITEGHSGTADAVFTVTLTPAADQTVTVAYATAAGTATAGTDFASRSGTLTFAAGTTTRTIAVAVNGDTANEPNETFFVNLSSPAGAVIADAQGRGTILNDDATTDLTPPAVVGRTPAPNAAGVAVTTKVTAVFNEPVVASSIVLSLTDSSGDAVGGALAYDATTRTATFTPAANLRTGAAYNVDVSGVQDFSGNVMPAADRWAFTTSAPGFQESVAVGGLSQPTAIQFAADGRVFIAEKSGIIKVLDGLSDATPTVFADLRAQVHNYWDRGLLSMALDPAFPTRPYVYVLYTHDAAIGGTAPRWGSPGVSSDPCPSPPGPMADGCVVSGRLSRLTANGNEMAAEQVLIEDWFQQFPSHSVGTIAFGTDGALYVSGGEGASFAYADYGQAGNPAGDPGGPSPTPPSAEGGALRAQDLRTTGDPTSLSGAIARVNPDTGAALSDNPLYANADPNARRIIAHGLRNPFRFAVRPRTSELWVGDVGWSAFEEINVVANTRDGVVENFGWPCYEGTPRQPAYESAGLSICQQLYTTPGAVTAPFFTYSYNQPVVSGETCGNGSSSISGITFYDAGSYPVQYQGALFFADYSRGCIWVMFAGAGGQPDPSTRAVFRAGVGVVNLQIGPGGDLFYADIDGGTIRRIQYFSGNQSPTARVVATPPSGALPLTVAFDGRQSSDPDPGETLTYAWDLDGDGQFDDSTSAQPTFTYTQAGRYGVSLKVTDSQGAIGIATVTVTAGNMAPAAVINQPAAGDKWSVGSTVTFSGTGTDNEDGTLPASRMSWSLIMHHCPSSCHAHGIQDYAGVSGGSFVAPDHEYPSYLELRLTVTDSAGLSGTTSIELQPRTVALTFASSPAGLQVAVGSTGGTAPFTRTVIVGSSNSISAAASQTLGGVTYDFQAWSDGGARTHVIVAPATPTTYTVTYVARSTARDAAPGESAPLLAAVAPGGATRQPPGRPGAAFVALRSTATAPVRRRGRRGRGRRA